MDTAYHIQLTIKTLNGPEAIGKFSLGNDRSTAEAIFNKLLGTSSVDEGNILFIDFIEAWNGLPVSLDMITCTLDQLGENCKLISKEIFKAKIFSPV